MELIKKYVKPSFLSGGVLGFWGSIGSMGAVFLLVLLSRMFCCRKKTEEDEDGGLSIKIYFFFGS